MQVILMERIEKLGLMGEVVNVKPGYARNYLLPQGKARRATQDNIALFEQQRGQLEAENLKRRDEAETQAGTGRVVSEDERRAVEEAAQVETDAALAEIEAEDADAETKSEAPAEGGAASEEAAKDAWERTLTLFRRVLV